MSIQAHIESYKPTSCLDIVKTRFSASRFNEWQWLWIDPPACAFQDYDIEFLQTHMMPNIHIALLVQRAE